MTLSPVTEQFISIDALKQKDAWRLLRDDERRFLRTMDHPEYRNSLSYASKVANIKVETGRDHKSISSRCWALIESRLKLRNTPTPDGIVRIINANSLDRYISGMAGYLEGNLDPQFGWGYPSKDGEKEESCGFEFVAAKIPETGEIFWTFDTRQLDELLAAGINCTKKGYHFQILGFHPLLDETTEIAIDDFSGSNNLTGNNDVHALISQFLDRPNEIENVPRGHVFELQIRSELVDRDIKVFMREANILYEYSEHSEMTYVFAMSKEDYDAMAAKAAEYHNLVIPDYRNEKLLTVKSLSEVLPDLPKKSVTGIIAKIHQQLDDLNFSKRILSECRRPFTVKAPTDNWRLFDYKDFTEARNDDFAQMGNNPLYPPYVELKLRVVQMPSAKIGDRRYQDSSESLMQIVLTEDPTELKTKLSLLKPYELRDISERKASFTTNKPVSVNLEISPEIPAISNYKECRLVSANQDKAIELLAILKGSDSEILKRFLALAYNQDESLKPEIQRLFGLDHSGRLISCAGMEYSKYPYINNHWSSLSETNQPRGYRFRIGGYAQESDYVCITGIGFHRVVKVSEHYFEALLPSPAFDSEVTITPIKDLKRGRAISMQVRAYRDNAREKEIAALISETICFQASLPSVEREKNLLLALMKIMPDPYDWEHTELERSYPLSESIVWVTDEDALNDYIWDLSDGLEMSLEGLYDKQPRPGDLYNESGLIFINRRHPDTKELLMTFDTRQLQKYIDAGDNQTDQYSCFGILGIHPDLDPQKEILLSDYAHDNLHGNEIIASITTSQIIAAERREGFDGMSYIPKNHVFKIHVEWRNINKDIEVFIREAFVGNEKRYVYAMGKTEYDRLKAEVLKHDLRPIPEYAGELFISTRDLYQHISWVSPKTISHTVRKIREELSNICLYIGYLKHFDEPFTVSIPTDYWQLVYSSFEEAQQDSFKKNDGYPGYVKLKFKFVINNSIRQEKTLKCAQKESMQLVFAEDSSTLAQKMTYLLPPSAVCDLPPATDDSGCPVEIQISKLNLQDPDNYFDDLRSTSSKKPLAEKQEEFSIGTVSKTYDGKLEITLKNNHKIPLFTRTVTDQGILVAVPAVRTEDLRSIAENPEAGDLAENVRKLIPIPDENLMPTRKKKSIRKTKTPRLTRALGDKS